MDQLWSWWTRTLWLLLLASLAVTQDTKSKRQIFREQVLPHSGGKIPESAFRTDRLALNKLQKLGVAVPDGVSLDTRSNSVVHVVPDPETEHTLIRILQEDEGRYVPPEGRSYPAYPRTVQSTYLIRPPIGSYHPPGAQVHRAVQGPALGLSGASVEATLGLPAPQPPHPAYQQLQFHPPPQAPKPALSVNYGGVSNSLHHSDISRGYNNNLYAQLIGGYRPNGLLHLTTPYRNTFSYPFFNLPSLTYGGSQALLNPDDLSYRLRRRVGNEGNHGSASETSSNYVAVTATFRCDVPGRETGQVYSDPLSDCKKQYICLEDGRAADYICPEGSVFEHRQGKCATRRYRRRRVKFDANCNPIA